MYAKFRVHYASLKNIVLVCTLYENDNKTVDIKNLLTIDFDMQKLNGPSSKICDVNIFLFCSFKPIRSYDHELIQPTFW